MERKRFSERERGDGERSHAGLDEKWIAGWIAGALVAAFFLAGLSGPAAAQPPSFTVNEPLDGATIGSSSVVINVYVSNFQLAPEEMGGQNVAGHGHLAIALDGQARAESAFPWTTLCDVGIGWHTLTISLHENDHTPINPPPPVTIEFEVTSDSPGLLCFGWRVYSPDLINPHPVLYSDGTCGPGQGVINFTLSKEECAVMYGPGQGVINGTNLELNVWTANFTLIEPSFSTANASGQGHYHVFVDDIFYGMSASRWFNVTGLAVNETHCLRLELVSNNHASLGINVSLCVRLQAPTAAPPDTSILDRISVLEGMVEEKDAQLEKAQADIVKANSNVEALSGQIGTLSVLAAAGLIAGIAGIGMALIARRRKG